MISIIICSRQSDIPQSLKDNIAETIGVEYELVLIDNSKKQYSIFQAYNLGVSRAKYPYLCFMHDDILYHTQDWGEKVINHFQSNNVGLIGVAGTHFLSRLPVGWWISPYITESYIQDLFQNGIYSTKVYNRVDGIIENNSVAAVGVDGFWFCIKKTMFEDGFVIFDGKTFSDYHLYDLDMCMQILELGEDVRIILDVLIEHKSLGNPNVLWETELLKFQNKWITSLPRLIGCNVAKNSVEIENELFQSYCLETHQQYLQLQEKLKDITDSYAYKLGKFLLKPFLYIRKEIKK